MPIFLNTPSDNSNDSPMFLGASLGATPQPYTHAYRPVCCEDSFWTNGISELEWHLDMRTGSSYTTDWSTIYKGRIVSSPNEPNVISFDFSDITKDYLYPTPIFQTNVSHSAETQIATSDIAMYNSRPVKLFSSWTITDYTSVGQFRFIGDNIPSYDSFNYIEYELLNYWEHIDTESPSLIGSKDIWYYPNRSGQTIVNADGSVIISEPINGHFYDKQLCFNSVYHSSIRNGHWSENRPYVQTDVLRGCANICADDDFNTLYTNGLRPKFSFNYDTSRENGAIYYVNAYGGWDSFAIEGKIEKKVDITNNNYYNFHREGNWGGRRRTICNEISTKYSLGTGYMSDAESKRFIRHLAPTTFAFLHLFSDNKENDVIYPITIDIKSISEKTFNNQGKKKFNYTFDVIVNNDYYRF